MADVDGGWPVVRRKKRPWLDENRVGREMTQRRAMRCGASKKTVSGGQGSVIADFVHITLMKRAEWTCFTLTFMVKLD